MENKKFTTRRIALIGVLSAMVFAATYLHIDIPTALGKTMLHLGNVVCILGGLLFGPLTGGLVCRIGMGKDSKKERLFTIIGGICGSVTYVILYVSKTIIVQYFINSGVWETVLAVAIQKGTVSLVNGLIAVIVSVLLTFALRPALKKAGIFQKL